MTRVRREWAIAAGLIVAVVITIWVLSRPAPRNDFSETVSAADHAMTLQTGDGWTLESIEQPGAGVCVRVRTGDRATFCVGLPAQAGDTSLREVRGLGHHVVVSSWAGPHTVDLAMFSGQSGGATHPMVRAGTGVYVAAVGLDAGEEAWGVHIVDAGRVLSNESFLP